MINKSKNVPTSKQSKHLGAVKKTTPHQKVKVVSQEAFIATGDFLKSPFDNKTVESYSPESRLNAKVLEYYSKIKPETTETLSRILQRGEYQLLVPKKRTPLTEDPFEISSLIKDPIPVSFDLEMSGNENQDEASGTTEVLEDTFQSDLRSHLDSVYNETQLPKTITTVNPAETSLPKINEDSQGLTQAEEDELDLEMNIDFLKNIIEHGKNTQQKVEEVEFGENEFTIPKEDDPTYEEYFPKLISKLSRVDITRIKTSSFVKISKCLSKFPKEWMKALQVIYQCQTILDIKSISNMSSSYIHVMEGHSIAIDRMCNSISNLNEQIYTLSEAIKKLHGEPPAPSRPTMYTNKPGLPTSNKEYLNSSTLVSIVQQKDSTTESIQQGNSVGINQRSRFLEEHYSDFCEKKTNSIFIRLLNDVTCLSAFVESARPLFENYKDIDLKVSNTTNRLFVKEFKTMLRQKIIKDMIKDSKITELINLCTTVERNFKLLRVILETN